MSPFLAASTSCSSLVEELSVVFIEFDGGQSAAIQRVLELAFRTGHLAGNTRISLTGNIYRFGERLENSLHYMVGLVTIQQLKVQVTAGFIGKCLKKLTRQPKTE